MSQKIFFIHIPKTGGTTLDWGYLQKVYDLNNRCCETDAFGVNPRRHVYAEIRHMCELNGVSFPVTFQKYAKVGLIPDVALYAGHMGYGAHLSFQSDYQYITIIRNPVDRVRSFLDLQASFNVPTPAYDLVTSKNKDYDNWQVRCLCMEGWSAETVSEAMLDEAINNLSNMFYTVTEDLDEFVPWIIEQFAWPVTYVPQALNKTVVNEPVKCYPNSRYVKANAGPQILELVKQRNQFDWRLYEHAKQTWKAKKGI